METLVIASGSEYWSAGGISSEQDDTPAKIPDMKKMAQAVDLEDEYNYFYKFTSKLLHFCPFSFNGDSPFEAPIHKVVFLMRSVRYMEKLKEELDTVYQKTILTN